MSTARALIVVAAFAFSCVALVAGVGAQRPLLPAVATPALFMVMAPQVPDPNHEGHKMREDGASCNTTGADACACGIRICTEDDRGNVTSYDMTSACQWFCHKDKCGCHPCLDQCPDGSAR